MLAGVGVVTHRVCGRFTNESLGQAETTVMKQPRGSASPLMMQEAVWKQVD